MIKRHKGAPIISYSVDRNGQVVEKESPHFFKNPHRVFKIGAPVILTTNFCKKTGIVNNAKGIIVDA